MLTSFDAGPNREKSHGASKTNSHKIYHHGLDKFGPWHDGETEDGDNADKIAQCTVLLGDSCGLIKSSGYGGPDRGSADILRTSSLVW